MGNKTHEIRFLNDNFNPIMLMYGNSMGFFPFGGSN